MHGIVSAMHACYQRSLVAGRSTVAAVVVLTLVVSTVPGWLCFYLDAYCVYMQSAAVGNNVILPVITHTDTL